MLRARTVLAVLLSWTVLADPIAAAAQSTTAAHEHHRQAQPENARRQDGRVMDPQPQIDTVWLVDSNGQAVSLRDAVTADVPVLVNFIFTSCTTICPIMSAGFGQLAAQLKSQGRAVRLVSISVDPAIDTPARLREYSAQMRAGSNWWFLTGPLEASEAAQRTFGTYRGAKENHAPATYVRRTADALWERLDGVASVESLLRAYHGVSGRSRE